MAILKYENLELEFIPMKFHDWGTWPEWSFKVCLKWKGTPVLNEKVMKRYGDYWSMGKEGGVVASEQDKLLLLEDFDACIKDKKSRIWESHPDPDMSVSIFPDRAFPYLDEIEAGVYTIIISPDSYQFKDTNCYMDYSGVSFVMVVDNLEFENFVSELKKEFEQLKDS